MAWLAFTGLVCFGAIVLLSGGTATAQQELFPGNPPRVPRWAFEPWVWEDTTNTQASTESLVQGYLERGIPVGAVIVDSPWANYHNDFVWDNSRYPDPQAMIDNLHARGVRVILWVTGFINQDSPDYEHVKAQGYSVGGGTDFFWWRGTGVHLDFTNPEALDWWHSKMDAVTQMGIDGWKVDRSVDYVSDPVATLAGELPLVEFRQYFYADFFDYTVSRNPGSISFARTYSGHQSEAGAPVSKVSVGWSGDFYGDFSGLEAQKNDVYEAAQRGYGAPGVEIGGYGTVPPSKNSLIRYTQFAAMTPLMENGGTNGGETEHLPWYWDQETVDIYRYFATLHSELVPYLFSYSVESNLKGGSILRDTDKARSQHLLGEEIFVSAITSDVMEKSVHFPAGSRWIDYWNETIFYEGESQAIYRASLDRYPIFIRAGAIIPMEVNGNLTGHGEASSAGKVTLAIYPFAKSNYTFHRPTGYGVEYSDVRIDVDEFAGTVRVQGEAPADYRLRIKSFSKPLSVTGAANWYYDPETRYVIVDQQGEGFSITIHGLSGYGKRRTTPILQRATGVGAPQAMGGGDLYIPIIFSSSSARRDKPCLVGPLLWKCEAIPR